MAIPYLRIVVPVVVATVAVSGYFFFAQPAGQDKPEESASGKIQFVDKALIEDYRTRAADYLKEGKYKEALELLLKLEELAPEDVAVHYAVARLYQSANMKAEARAALERGLPYLKANPDAKADYDKLLVELQ